MADDLSNLLLKLQEMLQEFGEECADLESIFLLDSDGFAVVSIGGSGAREKTLHRLIALVKKDFPSLTLLEIEDPDTRLCLVRVPETNYYIAAYAPSSVATGLIRLKVRSFGRRIKDLLSPLEKKVVGEDIDVRDLERFLEFLTRGRSQSKVVSR